MALTLHLGVINQPYQQAPKKHRRKSGSTPNVTTGDVAEILESKYGIMQFFVDKHMDDVIEPALMDGIEEAFEDLLSGAPLDVSVFGTAEGKIDEAFRKMLDDKEMDGQVPGVATEAAKRGVNHRLKRPYQRRAPRPSFIDTGLYQNDFKSWVV